MRPARQRKFSNRSTVHHVNRHSPGSIAGAMINYRWPLAQIMPYLCPTWRSGADAFTAAQL